MSFIGGMPKKNPHGRGLSSGRRPAEARRSDLNLSDVWAVSVDRRSAIERRGDQSACGPCGTEKAAVIGAVTA